MLYEPLEVEIKEFVEYKDLAEFEEAKSYRKTDSQVGDSAIPCVQAMEIYQSNLQLHRSINISGTKLAIYFHRKAPAAGKVLRPGANISALVMTIANSGSKSAPGSLFLTTVREVLCWDRVKENCPMKMLRLEQKFDETMKDTLWELYKPVVFLSESFAGMVFTEKADILL